MKKIVPNDAVLIPETATCAFEGVIYDTYQWQQRLFDGSDATFEMLRRADTVSTIGIVNDKIIVISDEQPHRGVRLTFPGGRVDATDEDVLMAAQREMHEETGYEFRNWRLVRVWQPQTKIEWFIYLYVAWDGKQVGEAYVDGGEKIESRLLPFEETKQLVTLKMRFLNETEELFNETNSVQDLLNTVEYVGRTIDLPAKH